MPFAIRKPVRIFFRLLIVLLALIVGLYPTLYFILDRRFSLLAYKEIRVLLDLAWNIGFYTHIVSGGLALLLGWIQFPERWRLRHPAFHRNAGKCYLFFALTGALSGIFIAFFATGGMVSSLGFGLLGIFWFYTSLLAFINARKTRILPHRRMAFYSYAACFAAVTLRLWLQLFLYLGIDFISAYRVVAWLSWVPNVIVADFLWRKNYKTTT